MAILAVAGGAAFAAVHLLRQSPANERNGIILPAEEEIEEARTKQSVTGTFIIQGSNLVVNDADTEQELTLSLPSETQVFKGKEHEQIGLSEIPEDAVINVAYDSRTREVENIWWAE